MDPVRIAWQALHPRVPFPPELGGARYESGGDGRGSPGTPRLRYHSGKGIPHHNTPPRSQRQRVVFGRTFIASAVESLTENLATCGQELVP